MGSFHFIKITKKLNKKIQFLRQNLKTFESALLHSVIHTNQTHFALPPQKGPSCAPGETRDQIYPFHIFYKTIVARSTRISIEPWRQYEFKIQRVFFLGFFSIHVRQWKSSKCSSEGSRRGFKLHSTL